MSHMDLELYDGLISGNHEVLKSSPNVVDQVTPANYTVLHLASQYGNLTCVAWILSAHPSLLFKLNSRGETALHLAARAGQYGVAKALINAAKSSVLQLDDVETASSTVLEFLITTTNVEFETALHEAVRYNYVNVVELLVTEDPDHLYPQNKNDETPLYMASLRGYHNIIKVILESCISPTYGGPQGRTALHAAVLDGHLGHVKLLLTRTKELIKVTDDDGWTAFHYAAYKNCPQIIKFLVGVDKSVAYLRDKRFKRTALHIAAHEGYVDVAKELLKHCPDSCDIVDGNGRNILHIAVRRNWKFFIRYILKNRKEVNNLLIQKDKDGNTPLHQMSIFGCYIPEIFNHPKVDLEPLNGENFTPLDIILSQDIMLGDQPKLRDNLLDRKAKITTGYLGRIIKEQDYGTGNILSNLRDEHQKMMKNIGEARDTHMIVAALIATVALTAGFAMPGGFDGNAGPKQGSPPLLRNTAFRTFVVTDTIALLCSMSSLFIYFVSLFFLNVRHSVNLANASVLLNILSIISMMLAFITGTYAVLLHSLALAIAVIVIAFPFFFLVFYLIQRLFFKNMSMIRAERRVRVQRVL